MGSLDTAGIFDGLRDIGKELIASAGLTATEKENARKWTEGMALALVRAQALSGEERAAQVKEVELYRAAFNGMLGALEVRAALASEKALLRALNLAVELAMKGAVAALL